MAEIRLSAEPRDAAMTTRALRRTGKVPGIFYNRDGVNRKMQFNAHEVELLVRKEIGVLSVDISGETLKCLIREVQRHPVRRDVLHVDLMGFVSGQKIRAHVPIHAVGIASGTKEGGTLELVIREVEVECLPADLPTHIDLDVTALGMHQALRIEDIKISGVTVYGDAHAPVVHVIPPRTHAEATPEATASAAVAAEPEVIREKKPQAEESSREEKKK